MEEKVFIHILSVHAYLEVVISFNDFHANEWQAILLVATSFMIWMEGWASFRVVNKAVVQELWPTKANVLSLTYFL